MNHVVKAICTSVLVLAVFAVTAGCPLPFDYQGKGVTSSSTPDPSSPSLTSPVTVSYSEQGGANGSIGHNATFVSDKTTTVTLSTSTRNSVIYYTDDGNPITSITSAKKFSGSGQLTVTQAAGAQVLEVYAIAIGPSMLPSTPVHVAVNVSPYPVLTVTRSPATTPEAGQTATFTITSSRAPTADMTVFLTTDGTYEPGDLTGMPDRGGPLTAVIKAGMTTASVSFTSILDGDSENEDVTLIIQPDTIKTPPAYMVSSPSPRATVIIQDNQMPALTVVSTASTIPDNGSATFTVTSSITRTTSLPVTLQTGGSYEAGDVTGLPAAGGTVTLTIPAGATSASVSFSGNADPGEFDAETVTLSLMNSSEYTVGSPGAAVVTMTDSSPVPVLTLHADRVNMTDSETAICTVTASVAPDAPIWVVINSRGYTAGLVTMPSSITIAAGATSAAFSVTPSSQLNYPAQAPFISLGAGTGYTLGADSSVSLLITDEAYVLKGMWNFETGTSSSVPGAADWTLAGSTAVVNGSLSLPGGYGTNYAMTDVSGVLNQNKFTIGVCFTMPDVSIQRMVIVGGATTQWLTVQQVSGSMWLGVNQHSLGLWPGSMTITAGQMHTLLLSFDLANLTVVSYFDGVRGTAALPAGFTWNNGGSDLVLISEDRSGNTSHFAGLYHWVYVADGALP